MSDTVSRSECVVCQTEVKPIKTIKSVTIEAQFHQLPGAICNQRGRGQGGSVRAAAGRAINDLLKQPGLKRKKFSSFSCVVSVGQIVSEPEEAK